VARWLRPGSITAPHGPREPLHRREMVIGILDRRGGGGGPLELRGGLWGERRQCPAVRPYGTPTEHTTSAFLMVSQSPSLQAELSGKKPPTVRLSELRPIFLKESGKATQRRHFVRVSRIPKGSSLVSVAVTLQSIPERHRKRGVSN
jgi:hypothetical protein